MRAFFSTLLEIEPYPVPHYPSMMLQTNGPAAQQSRMPPSNETCAYLRLATLGSRAPWLRLVAAAVLMAVPGTALDPRRAITQYLQSAWATDAGLPQTSVYSIAQTTDGYLWVGTELGLARFDGVRFTVSIGGTTRVWRLTTSKGCWRAAMEAFGSAPATASRTSWEGPFAPTPCATACPATAYRRCTRPGTAACGWEPARD